MKKISVRRETRQAKNPVPMLQRNCRSGMRFNATARDLLMQQNTVFPTRCDLFLEEDGSLLLHIYDDGDLPVRYYSSKSRGHYVSITASDLFPYDKIVLEALEPGWFRGTRYQ